MGLKDSYGGPNGVVIREQRQRGIAGAASATMAKFAYYQKTKVKRVQLLVETAGTNASAGVDIYNGTTSVGAVTVGTNTANSIATSGVLDTEVAAGGFLDIRGKANSATMVVSVTIVEQVLHDDITT